MANGSVPLDPNALGIPLDPTAGLPPPNPPSSPLRVRFGPGGMGPGYIEPYAISGPSAMPTTAPPISAREVPVAPAATASGPTAMGQTAADIGGQAATPSPLGPVFGTSRWSLTRAPGNYQQVPSYGEATQAAAMGAPGAAQGMTRLGKLLAILRGAGVGAAVGSTQPTFGTGFLAANQFQNQEQQQQQALQAGQMNLAMQRAQLAMLPEQQEFMRQQLTIAPRLDPQTGQFIGNMSEKAWEGYLANRDKGMGAATVAAASRERVAQVAAAAKVRAVLAGKRFQPVSGVGLFDTQNMDENGNPTLVPGSQQGVTISSELAQEYGIPQEFVGRNMSLSNLEGAQRMLMAGAPTVSYSRDPLTNLVTVSQRQKQVPAGVPGGPPAAGGPVTGGVPVVPRRRATAPTTSTATAPPAISGPAALQDEAAQLVEGNLDPSQIAKRGSQQAVVLKMANDYSKQKYGQPFDVAQASIDYNYAHNVQTQYLLKNMDSITEPGGAIDILANAAKKLPQMDSQTLNRMFNIAKTEFGDPALTNFHNALLTFAEKYAKVMGGGTPSDTARQQGLDMLNAKFSASQTAGAIDTMKQDLQATKRGVIGNNRYLIRQFGQNTEQPPSGAATRGKFDWKNMPKHTP